MGNCGRQAGLVVAVDEQTPDLLERHQPDEVLDVHPAVPKGAALAVGLGDLGLERNNALEARGYLYESGFHWVKYKAMERGHAALAWKVATIGTYAA
jgi:hypothetical protein